LVIYAVSGTALVFISGIDPGTDMEGRKTVLGLNSNTLGQLGTIAAIMSLDQIIQKPAYKIKQHWLIVLLPVFIVMIAGTGSRGAVISFAAALVVYFIFLKRKTKINPTLLFIALIFGSVAVSYLFSTEIVAERMGELDDDYRLRVMWPAVLKVFMDYPVLGTGAELFEAELASVLGYYRPAHNEFLTVLAYTGLVGMFFFLLFLKKLYRIAMQWRNEAGSSLQLALLFIIMFFLFKAGGGLSKNFVYIIFIILTVPYQQLSNAQQYEQT